MRIKFAAAILLAAASPAAIAQDKAVSISLPNSAPSDIFAKGRSREILTAQILLDRSRHSPGVVDGYMGANTKRAIRAYQRANGMKMTGKITPKLLSHMMDKNSGSLVQSYEISKDDVDGPSLTSRQTSLKWRNSTTWLTKRQSNWSQPSSTWTRTSLRR